jgi:hypothetical protein
MKTKFTNTALLTIILTASSFAYATKYEPPKTNPSYVTNYNNNIKPEINNYVKPEINNSFNPEMSIRLTNKSYSQVDVANLLKNQQEQLQKQFQQQKQGQTQTNGNNDINLGLNNIGNTYVPEQAPPVNAPGLVASTGFNWNTCLGSVSQGVSAAVFGESAATTIQIQVCIAAQMAQLTHQLRMNPLLAKELLCSDPGFNFAVHTLAVRGLDTECFGDPSANYVTPGGSNPHYRTLRPVVVPVPVVVNRKENTSAWLDGFNKRFPPINSTLDSVHREQMIK